MGTSTRVVANAFRTCYPHGLPSRFAMVDMWSQVCEGRLDDLEDLASVTKTMGGPSAVDAELPQAVRDQMLVWDRRDPALAGAPLSRDVLTALGARYESVDLTEAATIRGDLNTYRVPADLRNSFDLVGNFGTTEHVFNQANCFEVIHDFAKVGGHMVHFVPMTGCIFHCLYKYDPKYFILLARENDYEIVYAGFGGLERGREIDDRFETWARYDAARTTRCDSHLVEVILRKTVDQAFRPGFDYTDDDLVSKHVFPKPMRSLRDRWPAPARDRSPSAGGGTEGGFMRKVAKRLGIG